MVWTFGRTPLAGGGWFLERDWMDIHKLNAGSVAECGRTIYGLMAKGDQSDGQGKQAALLTPLFLNKRITVVFFGGTRWRQRDSC